MSNFKYTAFNQMLRESSQRSDYFECTCSQLNFPFSNFESLGSKEGWDTKLTFSQQKRPSVKILKSDR